MSQPKRYIACTFVNYDKDGKICSTESRRIEDPWGEFVQWSDYIEFEKYKDKLLLDYTNLKAENERLRKAGDAMYRYVGKSPQSSIQMDNHDKSKRDWLAAKEGNETK